MHLFKKLLAVILTGVFVIGMLAACGSSDSSSKAETTGAAESGASEGGVLKMVTEATFPPYEYYDGTEIVGIDIEIAQAIADELGMTLEVEDMAFDSLIAAVQSGKADMAAAGMTVTEDRLKNVNFSDPYATGIQVIIVKEDSDIKSVDDLNGKTVAVQTGTTGEIYAEDIEDVTISSFTKATDAVLEVINGKADAMMIDNEPAKKYVDANEGLKILEEEFTVEDYAIAIAKENTDLLDKINGALANLKSSGKLDEIVAKYVKAEE